MIAVDTLIISDIHLGYEFCRAEAVLATLAKYDFKQLILNGDIFDGLNFKRLHSEHWDVLSCFRHLTRDRKVVWVVGNHDGQANMLSRLLGLHVYTQYLWSDQGVRYLAIHGHQFDRFMSNNLMISNVATWFYDIIRKVDSGDNVFSQWMMNNSRAWLRLSDEVADKAINYGREQGVKTVFCGHTHIARILKDKEMTYYNSGCWTETPSHLITITGKQVELVAYD